MRRLKAALIAVVLLTGGSAAAADDRAPRNAEGQPDLQGVWNTHFFLPMEARSDMPSLTLLEVRPNWERCVVGRGQPPIASVSD
jgi:hypothetical protein